MKKIRKATPKIEVKNSGIHSRGVFAGEDIPSGARVIEYVGEKISKKESDRRADILLDENKKDRTRGAVYIFDLNKRQDLDGNVPYNTARLINHSCDPNCEAENIRGRIWIIAIRDIRQGEEITYNYGYDEESYEEHPCLCGSEECIGYILAEEHWAKLKNKIKREKNKVLENILKTPTPGLSESTASIQPAGERYAEAES